MLYQLPSGKVLYLSTEEYLGLNDQELHELTHCGYGDEQKNAEQQTRTPKGTQRQDRLFASHAQATRLTSRKPSNAR